MASFEDFAAAASRPSAGGITETRPPLDRVAVLGGGADARLIAALCLAEGGDVTLFSAYGAELAALRQSSGVTLRGAGPVGTYQVDRDAAPSIRTTGELDQAVQDAQVIFLTGPVHKQRTYAMVLAEHLSDGQILVLAPGRSLGALEAIWLLRIGGCRAEVTLVEAQNLPFWIAADGATLHLSSAGETPVATLPSGRTDIVTALGRYLPNLSPRDSVLASGFEDGSALVDIPALLIGGPAAPDGGPTIPMGGVPLAANQTFANLIGDAQQAVISALYAERTRVARAFGIRSLPDLDQVLLRCAGETKGPNARPVPDPVTAHGLIRDGVIGSLVPLITAAELAGVEVPVTQSMITLASTVLGAEIAAAGRRLDTIGIRAGEVETARAAMEAIAGGRA